MDARTSLAARVLRTFGVAVVATIALAGTSSATRQSPAPALTGALTFYAPFDGTLDASVARGDRRLYSAASRKEAARASVGAPAEAVQLARGEGRYGDALRVNLKSTPFVFFKGDGNIAYRPRDWSGTVSIWMRLDPDRDLLPGYSDPLIITPRGWNDAAMFVDFTRDDVPRRFRFAAFADRGVWDPGKREWEVVPVAERPMVEITGPRFASDRWTHVAWTWSHFNTGRADETLVCYLDGAPVGSLTGRTQTFTWEPREVAIALGVEFRGLMDELAIFNRALSAEEVRSLQHARLTPGSPR